MSLNISGAVLNSSSDSAAHHRFTVVVACLAFLLVIAGGLVTSNNAGLAVPDWPTIFGSLYKIPPLIGGVQFDNIHRMIGEFYEHINSVMLVRAQRMYTR